jgi:hypothetical protein
LFGLEDHAWELLVDPKQKITKAIVGRIQAHVKRNLQPKYRGGTVKEKKDDSKWGRFPRARMLHR